ncbi:MAG: ribulose-phosphate 3-epimerase [Anaerolineae bacterium]|nr:ribulose-phosphate 3-epimerase [Anaerolineae bacterium]
MQIPYLIAPSILSADFSRLGEDLEAAAANGAGWIHVDVMDGHFVPNLSMGAGVVQACRKVSKLPLDVHLMVTEPDHLLDGFAAAGADSLTVHVEASRHLHRSLQMIRQLGCKVGVALNPGTPAAAIDAVLHMVDLVLVMSVNPGYSGQNFLPEVLPKISELRRSLDQINSQAVIQVDGGITAETLPQVRAAGGQVFVAGNAVFKHPEGIAAGMHALLDQLK